MKYFLFIFILFYIFSCGNNGTTERNVCKFLSDCKEGYECVFNNNDDKEYGKCKKLIDCNENEDCNERLCNNGICVNSSPKILSIELPSANKDINYSYQLEYEGVKEGYFYFEVKNLPEGLSVSDNGLLSGKTNKVGEYELEIILYAIKKGQELCYNDYYVSKNLVLKVTRDLCDPNPCKEENRKICLKEKNSYKCDCNDGYVLYEGNCIVDLCKDNPCKEAKKGVCTQNDNSYECGCDEGYVLHEGNCIVDLCKINPCSDENRNKCTQSGNSYECNCNDGYTLSNDKCIIDLCIPNPCKENNKTECIQNNTSYNCECDEGYILNTKNNKCVKDLCLENSCDINTQNCVMNDSYDNFICECKENYKEINGTCIKNPCKPNPCMIENRSICVSSQDYLSHTCECDEDYVLSNDICIPEGDTCESAIDVELNSEYSGDTSIMNKSYLASCASKSLSKDMVYKLILNQKKNIIATATAKYSYYNIVLHMKTDCSSVDSIECEYRYNGSNRIARIEKVLEPGTYYFFVDGYGSSNSGEFKLKFESTSLCNVNSECLNNEICDLERNVCTENICIRDNIVCDNGQCKATDGSCECNEGYYNTTPNNCELDNCYNINCGENSSCVRTKNSYECPCDEGFFPTLSGACVKDPCIPNPCEDEHRTQCEKDIKQDNIEHSCNCDEGYELREGECLSPAIDICPGIELIPNIKINGDTSNLTSNYKVKQGYGDKSRGKDAVYKLILDKKSKVLIHVEKDGSWDVDLYLTDTCPDGPYLFEENNGLRVYKDSGDISETLNEGIYYIFVDGYTVSASGSYTLKVDVNTYCTGSDQCEETEECSDTKDMCVCLENNSYAKDGRCHEECEDSCNDNMKYECIENYCYRRETCLNTCPQNSACNTETLACECNEGYILNEDGECKKDLCLENNVTCTGENVSCNKIKGICECEAGYENYSDESGCKEDDNPCTPGDKCNDEKKRCNPVDSDNFECICKEEYVEDSNNECVDNPCKPNPCGKNSKCSIDENYNSKCSCKVGYFYNNLNVCEAREGNECLNAVNLELNTTVNDVIEFDNFSDSKTSSCQPNNSVDKIYTFSLEAPAKLNLEVQGDETKVKYALYSSCDLELLCSSTTENIVDRNLEIGDYYLHIDVSETSSVQIISTLEESLYLPSKLKDAVVNTYYEEKLIVKGGVAPYNVSLKTGSSLPEGLILDGNIIKGTPNADGNYSFILVVSDTNNSVEITLNLKVLTNTIREVEEGDLIINEIYYAPISDSNNNGIVEISGDEFIEIYNNSYKRLSLENISIWDSIDNSYRHSFRGTIDAKKSIVVFSGDVSNLSVEGVSFVKSSSGRLSLNDNGDRVRIIKNGNIVIYEMSYDSLLNESLNLNPDITGKNYVPHSSIGVGKFSPGKKVNGDLF